MKYEVCDRYGIDYKEVDNMESVMGELDVLYMTRVQKERFLDEAEFERVKDSFVLDKAKMSLAKDSMVVLHPLPRVNEILKEVDDDPRAAYFRQVENGKFVRMSLIVKLLEWAKQDSSVHWMVPSDAIRSGYSCPNRKCISNVENVDPLFRMDDDGVCHCIYCESKARSL